MSNVMWFRRALGLVFLALAVVETLGALHWRRRSGQWHAHRVAGVILCLALAGLTLVD